jgi:hypothetical protein
MAHIKTMDVITGVFTVNGIRLGTAKHSRQQSDQNNQAFIHFHQFNLLQRYEKK